MKNLQKEYPNKVSELEKVVFFSDLRHGVYKWLPLEISLRILRRKHQERIREIEILEFGEAQEKESVNWKRFFIMAFWLVLLFFLFPLILYSIYKIPQYLVVYQALDLTDNQWLQRVNEARATVVQAIGGLILLFGLFFTWRSIKATENNLDISQRATAQNLEIAQKGLITQRFSTAVELLGNDKIDVRLGGIYSLEHIAKESKEYHWTIMEILTAFVRENAVWKRGKQSKQIRTDIQAVLTVLGRRNKTHEYIGLQRSFSESRSLDLHGTNLQGADLFGADLSYTNLSNVNLTNSKILNTNLTSANLSNSDLSNSEIIDSKLIGATLSGTHFKGSNFYAVKLNTTIQSGHLNTEPTSFESAKFTVCSFEKANFLNGNFKNTKFVGGNLKGTELKGADFSGAIFDLIKLNEVNLREVEGLVLDQIRKKGVEYEKMNLPVHIQEKLLLEEENNQGSKDRA